MTLNERGYRISRNGVARILKRLKENQEEKTDSIGSKKLKRKNQILAFEPLIGAKGSLKAQVELAKAAILYPSNGLHTLIYGATGVGKSQMAECMYRFAIESRTKSKDAPFIIFNCAHYADNPQLLMSQL